MNEKMQARLSDETVELSAVDTETNWKQRIVEFLLEQPGLKAPNIEILKNTDPEFRNEKDKAHLRKRLHCLASQRTYMRQDLNLVLKHSNDETQLIGVRVSPTTVRRFKDPAKIAIENAADKKIASATKK